MPIAQIQLLEGRTPEQKQGLIEQVTLAIHESIGAPLEAIRVVIHEIPKTDWGIGGKSAKSLGR